MSIRREAKKKYVFYSKNSESIIKSLYILYGKYKFI
jgi:hypothetical protein